jgi:cell division transport system ATP-binding protein
LIERTPMTTGPIIALSGVSKRYPGSREILSNVSFAVEPGELVVLHGHSGAGKTTLLKLIAAMERPSSGVVLVGGQNVATLKRTGIPYLRRRLGLVFQDQKLLFDRSVFDNVMLPLMVTGVADREAGRRVRAALDKVGLLGREKSLPISLSGGEQQRLCIARAVVNRPAVLLADEPTSSLDANSAREVMGVFAAFHAVGTTLVLSTHDNEAVRHLPARSLTLTAGTIQ